MNNIMKSRMANLLLGAGLSYGSYLMFGFEMAVIVNMGFIYGTLIYGEVNNDSI